MPAHVSPRPGHPVPVLPPSRRSATATGGEPPADDRGTLRTAADDLVAHAIGRSRRPDPALGHSGGPAGNARLTAWTGGLLLALFLAELVTLLDVHGLISWHVAIGALLIPPALLKTATTGWRIVRYYTGNRGYGVAGPPPLLLRVLGPLVVASTLAVLASGIWLILVSPDAARRSFALGISPLMVHKATFVLWGGCTGLHVLGRLVPAVQLIRPGIGEDRVGGRSARGLVVAATLGVAALAAVLALSLAGPWRSEHGFPRHSDRGNFRTR